MMTRHLIRVTGIRVMGIIIVLILLLVIVVSPAQAGEAQARQSKTAVVSSKDVEQTEDATLVCLALVSGAALLAGIVWMRKLRRMLP